MPKAFLEWHKPTGGRANVMGELQQHKEQLLEPMTPEMDKMLAHGKQEAARASHIIPKAAYNE
ncbi:MAG TPA: hypothetical protein VK112_12715 [Fodinibius sp.]|nr:hypothetical protein [Fodinibius sp.]